MWPKIKDAAGWCAGAVIALGVLALISPIFLLLLIENRKSKSPGSG